MTSTQAPVGRLVVCPTPIGNLEDVTLRVLAALREAEVVACEDTRHTRVLLDRHGINARLLSLHEHNERARAAELVERIRGGAVVALVSDAGTPLVSDPGFALVRGCLEAGLAVEVLPGPSAVLAALVASGLPAERWCFVGFLPRKRAECQRLLERSEETLVAFESPRRLAATLALLAERDPERPVAVCRELTKLHEEVRRGSAAQLAEHYRESSRAGRGGARDRCCCHGASVVARRADGAARADRRGRQGAAGGCGGGQADRAARERAVPGDHARGAEHYTISAESCSMVSMDQTTIRLNVTLDSEHAAKLSMLAERTHVQEGTLARSLLSSALDEADPDPRTITALLDGIPGAYERAQLGLKQAAEGKTISLDAL